MHGVPSARRPGLGNFDLGVRPSCTAFHPLLPNSHQPRQNRADSGTTKIKVNPTQVLGQMNHPGLVVTYVCRPEVLHLLEEICLLCPEDVILHVIPAHDGVPPDGLGLHLPRPLHALHRRARPRLEVHLVSVRSDALRVFQLLLRKLMDRANDPSSMGCNNIPISIFSDLRPFVPPVHHVRVLVVNVLPDRAEDVVPLRVGAQVGLLGDEVDGIAEE